MEVESSEARSTSFDSLISQMDIYLSCSQSYEGEDNINITREDKNKLLDISNHLLATGIELFIISVLMNRQKKFFIIFQ